LDVNKQNYYRHIVAKEQIKKNNQTNNNKKTKGEWKQIMSIRRKIDINKLIITKADKGKTLVILTKEEYNHKIKNFIQNNHYVKINKIPTQQCQKIIKQTLKQCNNIIPKEYK
jgi:hypothetical protein